jgi:ribosome biogenesis GTPase
MADRDTVEGLIIRAKGAGFLAAVGGAEVACTLGGRFRLGESREDVMPVVGDRVRIRMEERPESGGARGLIVGIEPRTSTFARTDSPEKKSYRILGANMDRVILVFAVRAPELNVRLLDRMLVAAERGGMAPVVCVNKIDLVEERGALAATIEVYRRLGYPVILSSAVTGEGVGELVALMMNSLSIMTGPSGSGKTSLTARIQPGLELKIGEGTTKAGKGRHTTSHFELHRLDAGGYLGDTPGVREFGIWGVTKRTLARYFREFDPVRRGCRFAGCTHSHEPDCAVKAAVEEGVISRDRYGSYLKILETVPDD